MKKKRIVTRQPCQPSGNFDESVSPMLQRIYLHRGITQQAELATDLSGLPPPDLLKGMEDALTLLVEALHTNQKISIVGDFDADGATSTALAIHALSRMGFNADYLVPNRFEYGYGLTPEIVKEVIRLQKPQLIITVDNGISSIEGVKLAQQHKVKVLITDHHLPGASLPSADAIVNPNQTGCSFPTKNLAGVGVIFYVLSALRKRLREQNYFSDNGIPEPNLADYLDLVALGTVADVVPLDFYNRILVQQGLLRIRANRTRPGIEALIEISKRNPQRLIADDFGFALAPRLNAAGRMDDISTGIQCLLCENKQEAQLLAAELEDLNRDRKSVELTMQAEALQAVEALHLSEEGLPWGLAVFDESWHQGVVGLLASRLKERFHRPAIAFALADNNDTVKGSARSIEGFHIRDALDAIATQHPGLIEKFGGHAMAAGLSLQQSKLAAFFEAFDQYTRQQLHEDQLQQFLFSDGELQAEDLNLQHAHSLRNATPWGQRFPAPIFHGRFTVKYKRLIGEQHLRLVLQPELSQTNFSQAHKPLLVDGVMFFMGLELRASIKEEEQILIVYRLDANEYQGQENLQLIIEHLEKI